MGHVSCIDISLIASLGHLTNLGFQAPSLCIWDALASFVFETLIPAACLYAKTLGVFYLHGLYEYDLILESYIILHTFYLQG